jgi:hypothetical protein
MLSPFRRPELIEAETFSGFSSQGGEFSEGLAAVEVEPRGYVDRQGRLVWKSADWPDDA